MTDGPVRWIRVLPDDVERIADKLFLTRGNRLRNLSAYWVLLSLAAVIASAGVVTDSTATVIGAMIVAPLMTPILGTALALVLADKRQVLHCLALVVAGAFAVVAIAYVLGLLTPLDVVASTNSQVASRVSPRLIDLVAALATGLVGGFALIRSDVSDTLPGVAIAISLVPPLAVVGLTLQAGAQDEALGALLLFGTNVAAIIATGTCLLLVSRVRDAARSSGIGVGAMSLKTILAVGAALLVIAVPLTLGSVQSVREQDLISTAQPVAKRWASEEGSELSDVFVRQGDLYVVVVGAPAQATDQQLRSQLDAAGLTDVDVVLTLVAGGSRSLPAG